VQFGWPIHRLRRRSSTFVAPAAVADHVADQVLMAMDAGVVEDLAHLDELRRCYCCYRVIHVICDNARFHKAALCRKLKEYLAKWGDRINLHYLPTYAPETNPIERVWWHLHEEITRNHRCKNIDELLDLVLDWLCAGSCFEIETSIYNTAKAA
jgi:transposase